jgi:hypothetical protein
LRQSYFLAFVNAPWLAIGVCPNRRFERDAPPASRLRAPQARR